MNEKKHLILTLQYLQEAVPAAQEVGSLHDGVGGEDQLVLTERRLVLTGVDRLEGDEKHGVRVRDYGPSFPLVRFQILSRLKRCNLTNRK